MKKFFFFLLFLSLILCLPILFLRLSLENTNRKIEICLDWSSFYQKCREENYPWEEFLLKIRDYGISSVGIGEDTFTEIKEKIYLFSAEEREKLVLLGLIAPSALPTDETWVFKNKLLFTRIKNILEKKLNRPLSDFQRGGYFFLSLPAGLNYNGLSFGYDKEKINQVKNYGLKSILQTDSFPEEISSELSGSEWEENISGIAFSDQSHPKLSLLQSNFPQEKIKFVLPEFTNLSELEKFRQLSHSTVRLHYLGPDTYSLYKGEKGKIEKIVARLVRAVKERNVRLLYLYPLPKEFLKDENNYFSEQYNFFAQLKENLEKENFQLGVSNPFPAVKFFAPRTKLFRQFLAFGIALLFPILGLNFLLSSKKIVINFLLYSFLSLAGGILISVLLSGNEFFLRIDQFRGTKIVLVLPIVIAAIYLYRNDWREVITKKVNFGHFLIFLIIGLIFALFLVRSSDNPSFLLPGEDRLRSSLENIFWVRPRTKEFLFGHPLLILGLFLLNRPLIILGLIGQVSIINTFLHLHTPFLVSFYRVCLGIFLGTIFGLILIKSYQFAKQKLQKF